MKRSVFMDRLKDRIPARWHMSLICLATLAGGVLFSKGVLYFGLAGPAFRYGSAVLFSYGVFFVLVYLWLRLHVPGRRGRRSEIDLDGLDSVDLELPSGPGGGPGAGGGEPGWSGQGGQFSGGGSSGSWGEAQAASGTAEKGSSGLGEASALGDLDEGIVIVLVIGLLAAVFGSAGYFIYQAPEILFEAAFEVALAAGLFGRAKKMQAEGWTYSIFKRTWLPFVIILCLAFAAGSFIRHSCPEALSFAQYRNLCWNR